MARFERGRLHGNLKLAVCTAGLVSCNSSLGAPLVHRGADSKRGERTRGPLASYVAAESRISLHLGLRRSP